MISIIKNKGRRYLSEILKAEGMDDLPDNVFLNKVTTGCGMTSVALSNEKPYVICVPYKSIIINKLDYCKKENINAIGVYAESAGGASYDEIKAFEGSKILCTWDSLGKVVSALGSKVSDYKIMIDEAHQLIHSGAFRNNAIETVLENYTKFGSFIFGTATPIKDKYQLECLKSIPKVMLNWDNTHPVNVYYNKYDKDLHKVVASLVIKHYTKEIGGNAHIFINSVKLIGKILKVIKGSIHPEIKNEMRVVCSKTERNEENLKRDLGSGYEISSINSPVKKINFYTATAFEGCDIFDYNARTYIVSDGLRNHCKIDVSTILPQIIGRIRNAITKDKVHLLYSPSKFYSHTTEEEFEVTVKEQLASAREYVNIFNNCKDENNKLRLLARVDEDAYLTLRGDKLIVNETAWNYEMNAFETMHKTYYIHKDSARQSNFKRTVVNNEITYNYERVYPVEIEEGLAKSQLGKTANFSDLCEDYFEAAILNNEETMREINIIEPIIEEAYKLIGEDKMRALKLRKGLIEEEMIKTTQVKSNDWKIVKLLDLRVGQWLSAKDVKLRLSEVYEKLNLDVTAKATDLSKWFTVKKQSKRIDGDVTQGFSIITSNIKIK
jgi:hypothetical protein